MKAQTILKGIIFSTIVFTISGCGSLHQSIGSNERSNAGTEQISAASFVNARQLLTENSQSSRAQLAKAIETQFSDLLSTANTSKESQPLKVSVSATIKALIGGSQSLCAENEKITVFNAAKSQLPQTTDGKFFHYTSGVFEAGQSVNFRNIVNQFAGQQPADLKLKIPARDAGSALDYVHLSTNHSIGYQKSIFRSTSLSKQRTIFFGNVVSEIRVCPGRAMPTTIDKYLGEKEFLIFGFVLPEEIVKVENNPIDVSNKPQELDKCYFQIPLLQQTQIGETKFAQTGLRNINELLSVWTSAALSAQKDFASSTAKFVENFCSCEKEARNFNKELILSGKSVFNGFVNTLADNSNYEFLLNERQKCSSNTNLAAANVPNIFNALQDTFLLSQDEFSNKDFKTKKKLPKCWIAKGDIISAKYEKSEVLEDGFIKIVGNNLYKTCGLNTGYISLKEMTLSSGSY